MGLVWLKLGSSDALGPAEHNTSHRTELASPLGRRHGPVLRRDALGESRVQVSPLCRIPRRYLFVRIISVVALLFRRLWNTKIPWSCSRAFEALGVSRIKHAIHCTATARRARKGTPSRGSSARVEGGIPRVSTRRSEALWRSGERRRTHGRKEVEGEEAEGED